jgi:hypothetical protein
MLAEWGCGMATARQLEQPVTNLYEQDFLAWTENQAEALRNRQVGAIDWVNLLEEVESMGVSQRHEQKNRLRILLMHLIKWHWQPEKRTPSWRETIIEQRASLEDLMDSSPSLKNAVLDEVFNAVWTKAIKAASMKTGLPTKTFPSECPWAVADVMSQDWMPE